MILGKFLPPHRGHEYLLRFGLASVDELTVLVCSLAREPIPGELRARWVKEMVPFANVVHVTDENPQEPKEHPDFWAIWTRTIRKALPKGPDLVFSSEDYGWELARRLGARHIPVDPQRELVPVSGTKIRENPLAHWRYLPDCVKPYFVKRVCVVGPESTGKTTLCKELAAAYDTVWVSEYARPYLDAKPTPLDASDVEPIARGHWASESALAPQANRVLFVDTDAVMTTIYADIYYGHVEPWVAARADSHSHDLYLVCAPDVPWVADPQRDLPHRRGEIHDRVVAELTRRGRKLVRLTGDWDARRRAARAAVDALLAP